MATEYCERACAWLDGVKAILRERNKQYGDSLLHPPGIFSSDRPGTQIRALLDAKLARIRLGDGQCDPDSNRDIAGYLALLYAAEGDRNAND